MTHLRLLTLLSFAFLTATGFSANVKFITDPPGATMEILNPGSTRIRDGLTHTTPAVVNIPRRTPPYEIAFTLEGYQSETISYDYNSKIDPVEITLAPLSSKLQISFSSVPNGATVIIDGKETGKTPFVGEVKFTRESKESPWSMPTIEYTLNDYQSSRSKLSIESPSQLPNVELIRIRHSKSFLISAQTQSGSELSADVFINGQTIGTTPYSFPYEFKREDHSQPWSEFEIKLGIERAYVDQTRTVDYGTGTNIPFVLEPVTEVPVPRFWPNLEMTNLGASNGIDLSSPIGVLDTRDMQSPATDTRPVTNFQRDSATLQALNSFTLTPDGQSIIYSITGENEDGTYNANLYLKSANDLSFRTTRLTMGSRFLDVNPTTSLEEESNLIVFQSNRGPIDRWDISSFRLQEGRVVGGIQQLTRDYQFNYSPTFSSEHQEIYFIMRDERRVGAEPMICFTRKDGSALTNLGETGEMIHRAPNGIIYFVQQSPDTEKQQIYSITSEGLSFSAVINDVVFNESNCFSPELSPDGSKLLFVSDNGIDDKGRNNNDIFIYELESGRIQRITFTGADDVKPRWSPSEPGVVFFMSNRGGVYNLWRMRIVEAG